MIQVRKDVYTTEERLQIIQENDWEQVFDLIQNIAESNKLVESFISKAIENKSTMMEQLQTDEEKKEWYNDTIRTLVQINQAVFGLAKFTSEKAK
ncbi:hypothetical protein M5J14_19475 [Lysinibacillus sp. OL1_EC]|uniref:hypothetical protein n=1 Tax=unclassified Lysinibacillus TaxID=2636778 RepID=UPI00103E807A|nr:MULTISPECIES: hypothetical protein [unclassified Lysinibacillus]MCM0626683.1 hypothetical protein [Lysinibacillus sp. OL1_EC]TBV89151.1 hypothetical protein EW028_06945 [Lysinibacillus sp. OL1]